MGHVRLPFLPKPSKAASARRRLSDERALIGSVLHAQWYRQSYPDVAASGADPVEHYLAHGAAEGRDPNPFFDTRWYLETYPDVARSGMNPLVHYLRCGAAEGRDPGPRFSTTGYLELNPDVADSGDNALVHYVVHGQSEGRRIIGQSRDGLALSSSLSREALGEVMDALNAFSPTEPEFPSLLSRLQTIPVWNPPLAVARAWRRLFLSLTRAPRLVVVVGSADDPRVERYLRSIAAFASARARLADLLVVAADEETPSVGAGLPGGLDWRSLVEFGIALNAAERESIVLALIHNLRPKAVLVLDSAVGWRVLARAGGSLSRYCGLFAGFPPARDEADRTLDHERQRCYLRDCLPALSAVYLPDAATARVLGDSYGLPASTLGKLRVLPAHASPAEWMETMAEDPGFLSPRRAVSA